MVRSYDSKREPRGAPGNARNQTARPGSGIYISREAPWHEFTLRNDLGQQRPD